MISPKSQERTERQLTFIDTCVIGLVVGFVRFALGALAVKALGELVERIGQCARWCGLTEAVDEVLDLGPVDQGRIVAGPYRNLGAVERLGEQRDLGVGADQHRHVSPTSSGATGIAERSRNRAGFGLLVGMVGDRWFLATRQGWGQLAVGRQQR